jgi:hypothetical protein
MSWKKLLKNIFPDEGESPEEFMERTGTDPKIVNPDRPRGFRNRERRVPENVALQRQKDKAIDTFKSFIENNFAYSKKEAIENFDEDVFELNTIQYYEYIYPNFMSGEAVSPTENYLDNAVIEDCLEFISKIGQVSSNSIVSGIVTEEMLSDNDEFNIDSLPPFGEIYAPTIIDFVRENFSSKNFISGLVGTNATPIDWPDITHGELMAMIDAMPEFKEALDMVENYVVNSLNRLLINNEAKAMAFTLKNLYVPEDNNNKGGHRYDIMFVENDKKTIRNILDSYENLMSLFNIKVEVNTEKGIQQDFTDYREYNKVFSLKDWELADFDMDKFEDLMKRLSEIDPRENETRRQTRNRNMTTQERQLMEQMMREYLTVFDTMSAGEAQRTLMAEYGPEIYDTFRDYMDRQDEYEDEDEDEDTASQDTLSRINNVSQEGMLGGNSPINVYRRLEREYGRGVLYQAFTEYVDRNPYDNEELPLTAPRLAIYKNFLIAQLISSPNVNTRDYPTSEAYNQQLYQKLLQDQRTEVLSGLISEEDVRLFFREGELE